MVLSLRDEDNSSMVVDDSVRELATRVAKLVDLMERRDAEYVKRMDRIENSLGTVSKVMGLFSTSMEKRMMPMIPKSPANAATPLQIAEPSSTTHTSSSKSTADALTFKDIANALRHLKESVKIRDVDDDESVISRNLSLAVNNVKLENDKNLLIAKTESQTQNFPAALMYEYKSRCSPTVVESLFYFINRAVLMHQIADPNFTVRLIQVGNHTGLALMFDHHYTVSDFCLVPLCLAKPIIIVPPPSSSDMGTVHFTGSSLGMEVQFPLDNDRRDMFIQPWFGKCRTLPVTQAPLFHVLVGADCSSNGVARDCKVRLDICGERIRVVAHDLPFLNSDYRINMIEFFVRDLFVVLQENPSLRAQQTIAHLFTMSGNPTEEPHTYLGFNLFNLHGLISSPFVAILVAEFPCIPPKLVDSSFHTMVFSPHQPIQFHCFVTQPLHVGIHIGLDPMFGDHPPLQYWPLTLHEHQAVELLVGTLNFVSPIVQIPIGEPSPSKAAFSWVNSSSALLNFSYTDLAFRHFIVGDALLDHLELPLQCYLARMDWVAKCHHTHRQFEVADSVFVGLPSYQQHFVHSWIIEKLGLFVLIIIPIMECIVYCFQIPKSACLHYNSSILHLTQHVGNSESTFILLAQLMAEMGLVDTLNKMLQTQWQFHFLVARYDSSVGDCALGPIIL